MPVKGRLPRGEPLKFPQGDPYTLGNLSRWIGPARHEVFGDHGRVVIVTVGPEIIILDDFLRCFLTCQQPGTAIKPIVVEITGLVWRQRCLPG